jgi:hypothetical protein
MKLLATYCLLLAWTGYFALSLPGIHDLPLIHSEQETCHNTVENNAKDDCCSKLEGKEKEGSNTHSEDDSDCCATSDCSRTCCNISIAYINWQGEFNFKAIRPLLSFGTFENPGLPSPYLGRIYPPPNTVF